MNSESGEMTVTGPLAGLLMIIILLGIVDVIERMVRIVL